MSTTSHHGTWGVFLEEAAIKPHRSRYWLNPKIDDPAAHAKQVASVCDVYAQARALSAVGVHVVSCDEKTGMQALERAAPTRPTRPGLIERREFEYVRHGTLCLTGNFDVVTGKFFVPTIATTRNGEDFASHIEKTVATDPAARWIFIVDNLSTHSCEALVRLVASLEEESIDVGEMKKRGVLMSVASRRAFLTDPARKVRFVYTPKHCSWLNQIEMWFSILARRVLRRGSFKSTAELEAAVVAFIDYFNSVLAKPFRWTYTGRALTA